MINILIFGMGVSVTFIVPVDYQGALFRMFDYYIMKMFDKNMFNRYLMEKSLSDVKQVHLVFVNANTDLSLAGYTNRRQSST